MMLMFTDVGLNIHFYVLKLCATTENESRSLPSELFNSLILVKERGWGTWCMCDELPRVA
jgi:hypothetical protein